MIWPAILALAASGAAPPWRLSDAQAYAAIFDDIEGNAMFGNGNRLASWGWAFGHERDLAPTLQITGLACGWRWWGAMRCTFAVLRTIHPQSDSAKDRAEPSRIRCRADLVAPRDEDGQRVWMVRHTPPAYGTGGHSETSMKCRVAAGADSSPSASSP